MTNVGLIGFGRWGKILAKKLSNVANLKFICNSKDDYTLGISFHQNIDWVVIATPDETHYDIVKYCLQEGINVFCEKPLTLQFNQSKELYKLADNNNVLLYVNDVQNYHNYDFEIKKHNIIERSKSGGGSLSNILYRLTYHDIYLLYEQLQQVNFDNISVLDKVNNLHFVIDESFEFKYSINSTITKHSINDYNLIRKQNKHEEYTSDALQKMLYNVINKQVDFNYNKKITLFTIKVLEVLKRKIFNEVTVIGGGIFGCTTAWMLSKEGYKVTLYEQNNELLSQASFINQYRLHKGYHYPRSIETALSSKKSEQSFIEAYHDCVVNGNVKHYYSIASKNSLISAKEYIEFLKTVGLKYKIVESMKGCDLTVLVEEKLFDPDILRSKCWEYLNKYNVKVHTNSKIVNIKNLNTDYIVNATYSNINCLDHNVKDYQFELCEKPVVKLNKKYKDKSIVIMDGPFMCIDPLGTSGYHVMGNVVHAIHSTNTGKFPKYDKKFKNLLNNGIIINPEYTKINKFLSTAEDFFVDLNDIKHVGSMYTFRTVLPDREHDDARPTLVEKNKNIFNIFSGKIGTCVQAAKEVINEIR